MVCKGKAGDIPVCLAGKCQCAKKSGGDSSADTVKVMKNRLSGSIIDITVEGDKVVHKGVHFGQAALYFTKHFAVCVDSAKTHLRDLHIGEHLKLFPNVENPTHVVFETLHID